MVWFMGIGGDKMKVGDLVRAIWSDGLIVVGKFSKRDRGYVILLDENNKIVVCNPECVRFEVINESR